MVGGAAAYQGSASAMLKRAQFGLADQAVEVQDGGWTATRRRRPACGSRAGPAGYPAGSGTLYDQRNVSSQSAARRARSRQAGSPVARYRAIMAISAL